MELQLIELVTRGYLGTCPTRSSRAKYHKTTGPNVRPEPRFILSRIIYLNSSHTYLLTYTVLAYSGCINLEYPSADASDPTHAPSRPTLQEAYYSHCLVPSTNPQSADVFSIAY